MLDNKFAMATFGAHVLEKYAKLAKLTTKPWWNKKKTIELKYLKRQIWIHWKYRFTKKCWRYHFIYIHIGTVFFNILMLFINSMHALRIVTKFNFKYNYLYYIYFFGHKRSVRSISAVSWYTHIFQTSMRLFECICARSKLSHQLGCIIKSERTLLHTQA